MVKKILLIALTALLGVVFIISGLTKLFPSVLFELTFIDMGIAGWGSAPFIARIFIGLEFFLGLLLILQFGLRQFTLKAVIAMLLAFTVYLGMIMMSQGNEGNCKCFGNVLVMTPLESIIKNVIMIAVSVFLFFIHKGIQWKFRPLVFVLALLISFALPFVLNPVSREKSVRADERELNYKMEQLDVLYNSPDVQKPSVDLREGRHILACISLTCPHCRIAAYKMHIMKNLNPSLPLYFILNGEESDLTGFFADTGGDNIPWTMVLGQNFMNISGPRLPAIYWLDNGVVVNKTKYNQLVQDDIERWMLTGRLE